MLLREISKLFSLQDYNHTRTYWDACVRFKAGNGHTMHEPSNKNKTLCLCKRDFWGGESLVFFIILEHQVEEAKHCPSIWNAAVSFSFRPKMLSGRFPAILVTTKWCVLVMFGEYKNMWKCVLKNIFNLHCVTPQKATKVGKHHNTMPNYSINIPKLNLLEKSCFFSIFFLCKLLT